MCNTGSSATSVTGINFVWDDGTGVFTSSPGANAYINLRDGTLSSLYSSTAPFSLAAGACSDAYFEVSVNRVSAAYDKVRNYHITATDAGGTASTPTPRQLYVERLISQSRNGVNDVLLSSDGSAYTSIPAGGSMSLVVGSTYWIRMVGKTATNGYNQLESFMSLPNTIFQVLSAQSVYSAPAPNTTNDKLYADACTWDNDPNSPTYRSCVGSDNKNGGNVAVTYKVTILSAPSSPLTNPQSLTNLIYDFSGSSYHYNADYGVAARYANIVNPTNLPIAKSFSPNPIQAGGVSALKFTITNPYNVAINAINFVDTFPPHRAP